jgi:inhibitor of KinA
MLLRVPLMRIISASDSSLLIEFGTTLSPEFNGRVLALFRALLAQRDSRIRNLHPAYASLLIDFDSLRITHAEMAQRVREVLESTQTVSEASARTIMIPVCYDGEFGPDLADVASHHGISVDEVIRLHTSATYLVYFLGFSPGFAYLGGLDPCLHTPRLATPRKHVSAGSVGIASEQTGVYPVDSAGGWRLIGRTPLRMFDPAGDPPTRLQPGDHVRFRAISRAELEGS